MRLSTIFELLLIFLLIAFAAYARVIEQNIPAIVKTTSTAIGSSTISLKQAAENVNKYCACNENICNCCREFHIPLVKLSGPGCASLQYLQDDKLAMQLSVGDNILTSNIINGKNPKPVCVALPGGFSKFCGKIYSIKKEADKHFQACLGLELRSAAELEASLRVSCFRFGPDGVKLRPAEPLPVVVTESFAADDDYDIFGLDDDDDDDNDDDEDEDDEDEDDDDYEKVLPENNAISDSAINQPQDQTQEAEEDDEEDLLGFGALFDIFTGDDDSPKKKKVKVTTSTPLPLSFAIPILRLTTTPVSTDNESSTSKNSVTISTSANNSIVSSSTQPTNDHNNLNNTNIDNKINTNTTYNSIEETKTIINNIVSNNTASIFINDFNQTSKINTGSHKKINQMNNKNKNELKFKNTKNSNKIKNHLNLQNISMDENNVIKPHKPQYQNTNVNNETEEDYDYNDSQEVEENFEIINSDEEKDSNEEDEKIDENNKEDNDEDDIIQNDSDEDIVQEDSDYDEDEDDEDTLLSALVENNHQIDNHKIDKHKKSINKNNTTSNLQDSDYSDELAELLARKHSPKTLEDRK